MIQKRYTAIQEKQTGSDNNRNCVKPENFI